MTLAALFTLGNFVQLAAFLGLAYVLQQSYKAQPVAPGGGPWSRPGGAPSSGVGGQRYPQPISNLIESERRQHGTKRSPAEGSGSGPGAAEQQQQQQQDSAQTSEEEQQSMMTEVLQDYLARAETFREDLNDKRLTVEHVVLAMAEDPRFGEILSVAEGLDQDALKKAIRKSRVLYNRGGADEPEVTDKGVLSKYSTDLTVMAAEGKLDPVIGRHDELRRIIDVLCRRTKNSAVLLGEPGVGKTAIIHGLAQRLAAGDVPEGLVGASLISLELGLLTAGASFPGEFEERLRGVLAELSAAGRSAILFIDDIHGITGPNAQQGGGVNDASVMLKPLLARGEVRLLGATSADKYRRFIERDPGLERRFQALTVEAPSTAAAVSVLRGLRHKYEAHHGVRITDGALTAAVQLSDRYLPDRQLPDKAIDLIDEAASKVKTDLALKPEALDRTERRIRQLETERRLLLRAAELDQDAADDLQALEAELATLRDAAVALAAAHEVESRELQRTQTLKDDLDALDAEIEAAEEAGDADKAQQLRAARRSELVRKLRALQKRSGAAAAAAAAASSARRGGGGGAASSSRSTGSTASAGSGKLSRAEVGEADVARIISAWTGMPLTKLIDSEASRVLSLADELHRRIIGQDEAVDAVAEAIQRSRAGLKDPNGPIASFLFLGPTGVGKTELAKALAAALFNSEDAMVRLDMSEYMEKHAVARLVGAPPGYVGFDEGGQLTEAVRRRPYSVVLFDEVEKAHVDVFNILLQLLDDGRVTDSQGRTVSFKQSLVIMTSNLGSAEVFKHTYAAANRSGKNQQDAANSSSSTGSGMEAVRELVMARVRNHFRPEFLNRIDEFIVFEPLSAAQIGRVVELRAAGLANRVAERRMTLRLGPGALSRLAAAGYDPVYGARPVKRALQRELETPLARAILAGVFQEGDTIIVDADSGGDDSSSSSAGGSGALRFSRLPALSDAAGEPVGGGEGDGDDEARAAQPVLVEIPGSRENRTVQQQQQQQQIQEEQQHKHGEKKGGEQQQQQKLRYDPLRSRPAKQPTASGSGGGDSSKQQHKVQQGTGTAAGCASGGGGASDGGEGRGGGGGGGDAAAAPAADDGSAAGAPDAALLSGLAPDVAARLDGAPLPAFLLTPERRAGEADAPTQSH